MLREILKKSISYLVVLQVFLISLPVQAQILLNKGKEVTDNMSATGKSAKYNTSGDATNLLLGGVAATIIKAFLGILGIIFLIMILIGGYSWMTAAGEEAKVESGKKTLQRGIIGLIIIVTAYAITAFVFKSLSGIVGRPS